MAKHVASRHLQVAWVLGTDLRPYRLPFLRRLADRGEVEVTLFHGNAKRGIGAPSHRLEISDTRIISRPVTNHFWPFGGHRVIWQSGGLASIRRRFDVVVVPEIVHNLTVWLIVILRRLLRRPVVLFGFGYRPPSRFMRPRNLARRFLLRRADSVISYTERGKSECLEQGIDPARLFVLRNTVDTEHLRSLAASVNHEDVVKTRERYGLGDGLSVVFLGRLVRDKHFEVLIEAFSRLRSRDVDASLLVIGDGPERAGLERCAAELDAVYFVGPVYDELELAVLLMASDVLVVPGRIGLTCVHGFSYSLPALTTSETEVEQSPEYDYLEDGVNGLVLPRLDADSYADALERLAVDNDELLRLRQGAGRSAEKLTMSHMVDAWLQAVAFAHDS